MYAAIRNVHMTRIVAVRGALPPHRYPQAELTATMAELSHVDGTRRTLLERLHGNAGVDTRSTVLPCRLRRPHQHRQVNDIYIRHATALAARALDTAVRDAGLTRRPRPAQPHLGHRCRRSSLDARPSRYSACAPTSSGCRSSASAAWPARPAWAACTTTPGLSRHTAALVAVEAVHPDRPPGPGHHARHGRQRPIRRRRHGPRRPRRQRRPQGRPAGPPASSPIPAAGPQVIASAAPSIPAPPTSSAGAWLRRLRNRPHRRTWRTSSRHLPHRRPRLPGEHRAGRRRQRQLALPSGGPKSSNANPGRLACPTAPQADRASLARSATCPPPPSCMSSSSPSTSAAAARHLRLMIGLGPGRQRRARPAPLVGPNVPSC